MSGIGTLNESAISSPQATPKAPDPLTSTGLQDPLSSVGEIRQEIRPRDWSDQECMRIHKAEHGATWTEMHKHWKDDLEKRQRLKDFRKTYVDRLLNELRKKYPTLIAKSVGSDNITSDYDVTVAAPGSKGDDVLAMKEFNDTVKADFGKQPGTVFDTNLYAKDYDAVKGNIEGLQQSQDSPIQQPELLERSSLTDQDVAALVKVRRYMSQVEYDAYVQAIVTGLDDPEEQIAVRRQYEEADAIYQIGVHELLERLSRFELSGDFLLLTDKERAAIGDLPPESKALVRAQLQNEKGLHQLQKVKGDAVLEESNKLYAEKLTEVRRLQAQATTLEELASQLPPPGNAGALVRADALKAQAKKLTGDAIFFAAEAYHSEGAIKHVVAGIQASKGSEDEKQKVLGQLDPSHLLQSFNEQFGDFMKDIGHYASEHPGKVFYKTAKYMWRFFDAVEILKTKEGVKEAVEAFDAGQAWKAGTLRAALDEKLLPIRGEKLTFPSEEEKNRVAAAEGERLYGVKTVDELRQEVIAYSIAFNSSVRAAVSSQVPAMETDAYFG